MDTKKNLIIDFIALAAYLVVANPALTGIAVHEWLGLGVFVVFVVHVALHLDWAIESFKIFFKKASLARKGNLLLGILLLVVVIVVTVSGILMSGAVLPAMGLHAQGYYFWNPLHAIFAKVLLSLLVVHVAIHAKWLVNTVKNRKGDFQ